MKISTIQAFWIIFTFETGNMLLLTIGPAIINAKQDAWISFLIASISGLLIVFVATKVSLLFPNHTLIEYSKLILGKWLGIIIAIIYLIQWISVISVILSQLADFTNTILLHNTPAWLLILSMLLLMIYVTYSSGIEGIGRCSEFFGPIIILMIILLVSLSIKNMDYNRLLPVLSDSGLLSIFQGTLTPLSFFGEVVILMMLVSFMEEPKQGSASVALGVALSAFLLSISTISVIMIFGPEVAAQLRFPAFDAIRIISVMDFIQNLEIVAILVWILSVFIKLSVYFFSACYGTAQLLKIKDWRKTIWFVAAIAFLLVGSYPNISLYGIEYSKKYWIPIALPVNMIGIPVLLWIVGSMRKRSVNKHLYNKSK